MRARIRIVLLLALGPVICSAQSPSPSIPGGIVLDSETRSLEVVLDGTVASAEPSLLATYVDVVENRATSSTTVGATNGTTPVTIVPAPSSKATRRYLKWLLVRNRDSADVTVTLRYNDGGTPWDLIKVTLTPADLMFALEFGVSVVDANGQVKQITAGGGGGGGDGAPLDAQYLVAAANGTLTAERVATTTPTVAWDFGTAGQAKANVTLADGDIPSTIARDTEVSGAVTAHEGAADPHTGYQKESEKGAASGYASLDASSKLAQSPAANAITNAELRQGTATSVIGRSAGTTGNVADIAATTDGQVLQRASGALAFAALPTHGHTESDVTNLTTDLAAKVVVAGQIGGTASSPTVVGIRETGGPTLLTVGAIADGQCASRSGSTLVGAACSGGGGGGSPGGSSGQVQYNNAGAFGGSTQVTIDANDLVLQSVAEGSEPAAAAAGVKVYAEKALDVAMPALLHTKDAVKGFDLTPGWPWIGGGHEYKGCITPAGHGSTTLNPWGQLSSATTGTAAAQAWAVTSLLTRTPKVQYPSSTTAGSSAGVRANVDHVWRGNAAGQGGFFWWGTFAVITTNATQRVFVGLKDATAVTGNVEPNTVLDSVYFGANSAGTTLNICSNDNSGTATCTDLGASYPTKTAGAFYNVWLWAAPNSSSIGWAIQRLDSAASTSGSLSTDLPRNTVALGYEFWINNGTTAAAATLQFAGACYAANP